MSLMQEMKMKQEHRTRRVRLKQELEALGREAAACGQGNISRMLALQAELASVEDFLARTGGMEALAPQAAPAPPPASVREDIESTNLYVGSLAPNWTEELMAREFGRCGTIVSVKIMYPRTQRQYAFGMTTGFVQFETRQGAENARVRLNGQFFFGMALHIEFAKPVPTAPVIGHHLGVRPFTAPPAPMPVPLPIQNGTSVPSTAASGSEEAAAPTKRRSKFDMAKTFSVVIPADRKVRLLIDKTAEFVVTEGWEFEKLLLEKEKTNPRFAFLLTESAHIEDPLHLYYRWKTFSFSQGDLVHQWRIAPFQIYVNGPLWQPPACNFKDAEPELPVSRLTAPRVEFAKSRPGGSGGAGSGELSQGDAVAFDKLIDQLDISDQQTILEAMVFCLDNSTASQEIARSIKEKIIQAQPQLSPRVVFARLCLLSDVLFNAHCSKSGAATYRRLFQQCLPDIFERLRDISDGLLLLERTSLRENGLNMIRTWGAWSSFPRQFTQGLEATLARKTSTEELQKLRRRWAAEKHFLDDKPAIEWECKTRGLATEGALSQLVDRLCHYEAYWGEKISPDSLVDPELDGDPLDDADLARF